MFSLAVSFIGLYTRNFQLQFIENRNYPGGPMAWGRTQFSSARFVSPIVISVVISWLADGFLVSLGCFTENKIYILITLPNSYTVAL